MFIFVNLVEVRAFVEKNEGNALEARIWITKIYNFIILTCFIHNVLLIWKNILIS